MNLLKALPNKYRIFGVELFQMSKESQEHKEVNTKISLERFTVKDKKDAKGRLSFFARMKHNRFWIVRAIFYILYSIWMVVVVIALIFVWLISWMMV